MPHTLTHDLPGLLEKHFGYTSFRPLQEEIIHTILEGHDALVVMPTGSGKSLCFQMPALCIHGVTLVISPLIALMKDQVDGLKADGIAAAFLNSSQTAEEQEEMKNTIRRGDVRLLYIAPERLSTHGFQQFLQSANIGLIAIDEAHCISEWGHEFRPDYRNLVSLRESFPDVPCIALTATATPRVREDIAAQLKLSDAQVFLSSFNRENLTYHVYNKDRSFERLLLALRKPNRLPAIVYCYSRKDTESLADELRSEGFTALPYHAGLDQNLRRTTQEKFMRDEVSIVVATVAFGMGIDKPDVRTVVHMDLPKNIEGYYQETGRAGRDGLQSDCILFFSYGDKFKQDFFINQMQDPEQQKMAREKLKDMLKYGELHTCRRAYLLRYFDDHLPEGSCNGCDRCLQVTERIDATEVAQKILSAVVRTGERFGGAYICDLLLGKNTARLREQGHMGLPVYGIVKDFGERQLREIIESLQEEKLLAKADGQYPTLYVTEAGKDFLLQKKTLMLRKPEEIMAVAERGHDQDELPFNTELFEELRALRRGIAEEQNVAAFVVFGDRSLREMATYFPQSPESFGKIYGISDRKQAQYAGQFLPIIRKFAAEHGLQEVAPQQGTRKRRRDRAVQRKGSTYDETRTLLEQKKSLEEIASIRNLAETTIVQHIEKIIAADDSPPNIEHLQPSTEVFEEIATAFAKHGTTTLAPVFYQFNGKYSYETIRLVRLFL